MNLIAAPQPDRVGAAYDETVELHSELFGDDLHFGFWSTDQEEGDPDGDGGTPYEQLARASRRLTDEFARRLHVRPGQRILDIGSGAGGPAVHIAKATGAEVVGITVSSDQVRQATALAEKEGLSDRVSFRLCDATRPLPFAESSFDAVLALESFIHIEARHAALTYAARVLRPGGRIVLSDFFERSPVPPEKQPAVERYCREFNLSRLAKSDFYPRLFQNAGFVFAEQLDITEATMRPTILRMGEIARGREFRDRFGERAAHYDRSDLLPVWELGYLLVAGVRSPSDTRRAALRNHPEAAG
ncbi:SAM-dependent methyltransferase [Streptomyces sp. NPDC059104]|uniref:SAM-dependent methyltransferase n=1 Tax=Streptomyces sp. NPDC059104 TaxID=3346729 RepID=UPI0036C932BD